MLFRVYSFDFVSGLGLFLAHTSLMPLRLSLTSGRPACMTP